MENEKKGGSDEKACCAKKCCGKALAAFALLAIGGAGGYLAGKCCAAKADVPAVSAPAK